MDPGDMSKIDDTSTRKTKKYTGCWTCRKRGVRCDERRPGCRNCLIHKVKCEGYMVKLCWGDNNRSSSEHGYQRSRCLILYKWKENQLLNEFQVDSFLERIETASVSLTCKNLESTKEVGYGPFTVFNATCKVEMGICTRSDSCSSNESRNITFEVFAMESGSRIRERLEQASFQGLYGDLEIEIVLLNFWNRYFSKTLTPVDDSEMNPYNLMLKEALDKPHAAELQRAILHTVCAICSSFLSTSADHAFIAPQFQHTNFHEYRKFHKIRALSFVSDKYSWKDVSTSEELSFLAGSICFMLATDCFNSSDEWQIHLGGAVSALKAIGNSDGGGLIAGLGQPEGLSGALLYFSQLTRLAYLKSALYMQNDDLCHKYLTLEDLEFMRYPEENMTESLIYRNLGITPGMMNCLTSIVRHIQLAKSTKYRDQAIFDIELELIDCKPPAFNASMHSANSLIVYHQSFIFHTAISLLFLTEVKKQDPQTLQDLVGSGIDHIEICEEISKGFTGLGLFWPAFIICCEATSSESQTRVTDWLRLVDLYCVDTMRRGSRVVERVWERRKGGEQVSWLSVIRDIDSTLYLA
ncbi:unnamed protein product [Kuraishia capsulata CBS 1993]|uniref:Zn(2)-C6 fungal-type domain-containing protein n=1 Tax=Kuraishia capsulata CBS 1993 TaxID=1382522 RepID=W6MRX9_9ASCO|nr:uncharacterized protein KUCA_T00005495001 [Kuraishia capsulata CBS 1993]CDK29506.1 unnamed protein product [Kuraishia capsulata CBS 1993]